MSTIPIIEVPIITHWNLQNIAPIYSFCRWNQQIVELLKSIIIVWDYLILLEILIICKYIDTCIFAYVYLYIHNNITVVSFTVVCFCKLLPFAMHLFFALLKSGPFVTVFLSHISYNLAIQTIWEYRETDRR